MKRKKKRFVEEFIKKIDLQEKRALIFPYKEYDIRLVLGAGRIRISIIDSHAHIIKDYPFIYDTPISILEKTFIQLINEKEEEKAS